MVSDSWGRKTSFGLATLFTTLFGFATAAAPNFHVSRLQHRQAVIAGMLLHAAAIFRTIKPHEHPAVDAAAIFRTLVGSGDDMTGC
jgi:hypothetical protein